jgi:hypothetical protein
VIRAESVQVMYPCAAAGALHARVLAGRWRQVGQRSVAVLVALVVLATIRLGVLAAAAAVRRPGSPGLMAARHGADSPRAERACQATPSAARPVTAAVA